jgi:acetylornithine deacetylase/succinyl-diaminopimelate desuccinylase-like protein
MKAMNEQLLEWSRRLIACRSVTGEGTREITQLCAHQLLKPLGFEPRLIPSQLEGEAQVNLVCRVPGREYDRAPIVLNTHLDTVPPGDSTAWTECPRGPFEATIRGDRIYGLGAADTKLDFIAKVMALTESGPPRREVYLVATFGEEHGLVGAKEIAETGMLPPGALAFVGEPSRLQVITAHKGLMVFRLDVGFERFNEGSGGDCAKRLIFEGKSAHSSTPALGLNAIRLAIDALASQPRLRIAGINGGDAVNKVPALCDVTIAAQAESGVDNVARTERSAGNYAAFIPHQVFSFLSSFVRTLGDFADRAGRPEPDYPAPTLTCNPGVIQSQDHLVSLEFELRPPPALSLEEVRTGVFRLVEELSRSWPELSITALPGRANPGFRTAYEGETIELAMAALAAAGLPLETGVKAGCTEAGVYAAAGLRPVVFGPGPSTGVIHAPNEYNLLSDVEGALRFYQELLQL